jgi:hypothetical protein
MDLESTETCPIKATNIVLDIIRVNNIAIKNSKTVKVTAVVVIMSILEKYGNSQSANVCKNCLLSQRNG